MAINKKYNDFISVVIPVYNSQETIGEVTEKLMAVLPCFADYEIILINDNSEDKSWVKIKQLAESNEKITAVNLLKNTGQQLATFLGLKYARGDYIIIMDDDLAHNADDIIPLYTKIKKGYDAVYAVNKKDNRGSKIRSAGSKARDIVINIIGRKPKDIYVSSFRIIDSKINKKVIVSDKDFIYISLEILKHTKNIGNIYVAYMQDSPTNYTLKKLILLIYNILIYYSRQKIIKTKTRDANKYEIGEIINGEII